MIGHYFDKDTYIRYLQPGESKETITRQILKAIDKLPKERQAAASGICPYCNTDKHFTIVNGKTGGVINICDQCDNLYTYHL